MERSSHTKRRGFVGEFREVHSQYIVLHNLQTSPNFYGVWYRFFVPRHRGILFWRRRTVIGTVSRHMPPSQKSFGNLLEHHLPRD